MSHQTVTTRSSVWTETVFCPNFRQIGSRFVRILLTRNSHVDLPIGCWKLWKQYFLQIYFNDRKMDLKVRSGACPKKWRCCSFSTISNACHFKTGYRYWSGPKKKYGVIVYAKSLSRPESSQICQVVRPVYMLVKTWTQMYICTLHTHSWTFVFENSYLKLFI